MILTLQEREVPFRTLGDSSVSNRSELLRFKRRNGGRRRSPRLRQADLSRANAEGCAKLRALSRGQIGAQECTQTLERLAKENHAGILPATWGLLGDILHRNGEPKAAAKFYKKALAEGSEDFELIHDLGVVYVQLQDHKKALAYFKEALALAPQDSRIHASLAGAYLRLNMPDQALQAIEKAKEINPRDPFVWLNLAAVRMERNETVEAARCYGIAAGLPGTPWESYYLLGRILERLERWHEALDALRKAQGAGGRNLITDLGIAECLMRMGNYMEARGILGDIESTTAAQSSPPSQEQRSRLDRIRQELLERSRLSRLVDLIEIDLPNNVDFGDWHQLSAYLNSRES